jgi:NADPH2:quinone reductase
MRTVQVQEPIGPEGLRVVEAPEPEGELMIDVRAAGVSFPDLLLSRGEYQLKPDPPFTLGLEAAGVVRTAPSGSGFAQGDRVAAFAPGAFAELVAASPQMTFKLPDALSFEQGAGLVVNYQTAHFALVRRAGIRAGEKLLVHGAGGGVGTAAIQVGAALGVYVVGVVSSDEKERAARDAGADEVVRSGDDWPEADVIFDPVGGDRLIHSLRRLKPEGRLVVIGFAEGRIPEVRVNRLLFRNVSLVGAGWGHFALERPAYTQEVAAELERMIADGFVRPLVGRTYALEDAAQALRDLGQRRGIGKLVLKIASSHVQG